MVGKAIEYRCRHLGVSEDRWPLTEVEVSRHDNKHALVDTTDEVEQQLAAGLCEGGR